MKLNFDWLFFLVFTLIYIIVDGHFVRNFGPEKYQSVVADTIISFLLLSVIIFYKKYSYYGLKKVKNPKKYLYFIPLILIASLNLWNGININNNYHEILFFILRMINIGFIEEIIFRGFLFKALERHGTNKAAIVSSIVFGIGHILNLFCGAELISTLVQIFYSFSIGYLYAIIFYKSGSLLPCIITHQIVNSLCIFNIRNNLSTYAFPIVMIVTSIIYSIHIQKLSDKSSSQKN